MKSVLLDKLGIDLDTEQEEQKDPTRFMDKETFQERVSTFSQPSL